MLYRQRTRKQTPIFTQILQGQLRRRDQRVREGSAVGAVTTINKDIIIIIIITPIATIIRALALLAEMEAGEARPNFTTYNALNKLFSLLLLSGMPPPPFLTRNSTSGV